jgi:ABC-type phosphate/phosphonate transport system substrate-binding protein
MRAMISMYDMPERRPATEAWWAGLTRHWQMAGLRDIPEAAHTPDGDLYELWQAPDLFIAQTCGFPLTHRLKDRVTLVGTPVYALDGCDGGSYHSVIVTRKDSDVRGLDEVAGKVAAINGYDSQSGWNALRHSLIGKGAPARIVETGGHRRSVAAVREGRADIAAIDCVSYAGLWQLAPQEVAPLRIIARSASAPALPFVTRRDIAPADLERLRAGLRAAMTDPALAGPRAAMQICGLEIVPLQAYDRLLEMEREADRAGSMVVDPS